MRRGFGILPLSGGVPDFFDGCSPLTKAFSELGTRFSGMVLIPPARLLSLRAIPSSGAANLSRNRPFHSLFGLHKPSVMCKMKGALPRACTCPQPATAVLPLTLEDRPGSIVP